ncbi:hypothetical protein m07a_11120 [Bartonella schoenbuchensis m07a]|uniref:Uncharacterized protein n=1 Tax=Bartonella schoenbuchensis m07a TaxID=1094496 RepID=N6VAD8_9HYPH|nr:hypothetical protein m07a_11120 [Bartonella schoenbuchensis m07a]
MKITGKDKGYGVYAKRGGANLTMTLDNVSIKGVEKGVRMEGKSLTISGHSTISLLGGLWGEVGEFGDKS